MCLQCCWKDLHEHDFMEFGKIWIQRIVLDAQMVLLLLMWEHVVIKNISFLGLCDIGLFQCIWSHSQQYLVRKSGLKFNVRTLLPMAKGEEGLQITLSPNGGQKLPTNLQVKVLQVG